MGTKITNKDDKSTLKDTQNVPKTTKTTTKRNYLINADGSIRFY